MHDHVTRARASALISAGVPDHAIASQLGVPRRTVNDWRRAVVAARCPRCWRGVRPPVLAAGDYAELLGLYLGDGHVSGTARTQRLRLSLDSAYGRGCFRSDGCAFVNRTGRYAYPSYDFTNHSAALLALFADTCAQVGVESRVYAQRVRMYRRPSVALMQAHVGGKA